MHGSLRHDPALIRDRSCSGSLPWPAAREASAHPGSDGTVPNGSGPAPEPPRPGEARGDLAPTTLRRLTRAQYNNTVRDLLGIDRRRRRPGFGLDEDEGGFAANAKAPLKELQIEKYRAGGRGAGGKAVANLARLAPCAPPARPEADCLDEFLRGFGKRAYRRPLTAEEIERYQALFAVGRDGRRLRQRPRPGGEHDAAVAELPLPARAGRPAARRREGLPLTALRDRLAAVLLPAEHHARRRAVRRRRRRPAGHGRAGGRPGPPPAGQPAGARQHGLASTSSGWRSTTC